MPRVRRKLLLRNRKVLRCDPTWAGSFEGYVTNFLKCNFWRVESTMTYEDCENECYVLFLKLKAHYSVQEPKHFMALFKTSLSRRFIDLANLDSELRGIQSLNDVPEGYDETSHDVIGEVDNDGGISIALQQAPNEVVQVLKLLLHAPAELLELAQDVWRGNGHNDVHGNNFINAALGRQKGTDSIGEVRKYFG